MERDRCAVFRVRSDATVSVVGIPEGFPFLGDPAAVRDVPIEGILHREDLGGYLLALMRCLCTGRPGMARYRVLTTAGGRGEFRARIVPVGFRVALAFEASIF